jgi:hypothetical protein
LLVLVGATTAIVEAAPLVEITPLVALVSPRRLVATATITHAVWYLDPF